jgi:hypothetical protein
MTGSNDLLRVKVKQFKSSIFAVLNQQWNVNAFIP